MMKRFFLLVFTLLAAGLWAVASPAFAAEDKAPKKEDKAPDKKKTTFCKYSFYGTTYTLCTSEKPAVAQKSCEERAEKQHKEKLTCWCTDDPKYVQDACN